MRTAPMVLALLVASALAGCTGGNSEDQPDDAPSRSGTPSGEGQNRTATPARAPGDRGPDTVEASLDASATNGTAPMNVTFTFDASADDPNGTAALEWTLEVWHHGNGTRGNGTDDDFSGFPGTGGGNGTPDNTGSGTGTSSSSTSTGPDSSSGNTTGTSGGNSTSTTTETPPPDNGSTGNSTGTGTSSTTTTGGTNSTGNSTTSPTGGSNSTSTTTTTTGTNATGNQTGNGTAGSPMRLPGDLREPKQQQGANSQENRHHAAEARRARQDGTLVASFNGTGEELPGERSVLLNATGRYTAVFSVGPGKGLASVRTAAVDLHKMAPGTFLGNETRTFEGSFLASEPFLCMGSEQFEWPMNATHNGTGALADHVWATVELDGMVADVELTLLDPNGTEVASGPELDTNGTNGTGFPAGLYTLLVESCVSAETSFKVTATARYVSE